MTYIFHDESAMSSSPADCLFLNFIKTHFIDVMMHKLRGFHGLNLDLHLRQLDD